jgi:hypothetical protein
MRREDNDQTSDEPTSEDTSAFQANFGGERGTPG